MVFKYIVFGCLFCCFVQLNAQTNYSTKKGHVKFVTKLKNQPINAESHKLILHLDYDAKEVHGSLDLKSIISDNGELNDLLNTDQPLIVRFSGTIPANDFMNHPHETLEFNWLLNVSFQNKDFEFIFKTSLDHIEEGSNFACRLSAMGTVLTGDIELSKTLPNLNESIEIQFVQLILKI